MEFLTVIIVIALIIFGIKLLLLTMKAGLFVFLLPIKIIAFLILGFLFVVIFPTFIGLTLSLLPFLLIILGGIILLK